MTGNYFAVLVGINTYLDEQNLPPLRYAEKDCHDMYDVITRQNVGKFTTQNTKILTGREATVKNIEEALYMIAVKDKTPEDTVFVYFSGHGFLAGDRSRAYLGTNDVLIKDILRNPNSGLRMNRVFEDFFVTSPAKEVVFIIDCCHSGALTPTTGKGIGDETRGLIDKKMFTTHSGRMVIVACPEDAVSRESSELENGVFTHYILRGLKGEAVENNTGEVTVDSLLSFFRSHAPSEQPPGSYGYLYGRTVLSNPGVIEQKRPRTPVIGGSDTIVYSQVPQTNPLDLFVPIVSDLMSLEAV